MKRIIGLLLLMAASLPGQGLTSSLIFASQKLNTTPFSLIFDSVNPVISGGCSPTCPTQNTPLTIQGNALVVFMFSAQNVKLASIAGAGTWTFPTNCNAFDTMGTAGGVTCAYTMVSSPTAQITPTLSGNTSSRVQFEFREYHLTGAGTLTAENVPVGVTSTSCGARVTPCVAPSITPSSSTDMVISAYATSGHACQVLAPYRNFNGLTNGWGAADNINTASGTGASFIQAAALGGCLTPVNGFAAMVTIAFYPQVAAWTSKNNATTLQNNCMPDCGSVTIPVTTTGNLLILFAQAYNTPSSMVLSSIVGQGTWVFPSNCSAFTSGGSAGTVSCAYTIVTTPGTTVDATLSGSTSQPVAIATREYNLASGTIGAEVIPAGIVNASCGTNATPCTAPSVTVTGTNDLVVSAGVVQGYACGLVAPFGNFLGGLFGEPSGDHLNTTSGAGMSFVQATGSAGCPSTLVNQNTAMVTIGFSNLGGAPGMSLGIMSSVTSISTTGTVITYTYTITNTGGPPLNGPFSVNFNIAGTIGVIASCGMGPITTGQSTSCQNTHTSTQADLDSGSVVNSSTASGNSVMSSAMNTVTAVQSPALTMQTVTSSPTSFSAANQTLNYSIPLLNSGNVTLQLNMTTNRITVSDSNGHLTNVVCPTSPLAPSATMTCTGSYVTQTADVTAGSVTTITTATTQFP